MLIGRESDRELLSRLATNPPAVVLVTGDAGIGKSTLVTEAIGASERRMLRGHCHALREPFPLGCVIEALRGLRGVPPGRPLSAVAGTLRPLVPEIACHLPAPPDRLDDPRAERHRTFRALRELLAAHPRCVLVLEDLQWADQQTIEFLGFLLSDPPSSLAVVLTYREQELDPSSQLRTLGARLPAGVTTAQIELGPLAVREVRALGAAILGAEVPESFAMPLYEWTAGIPFAVHEVMSQLRRRGRLELPARPWPVMDAEGPAVPRAVRDLILQRLRGGSSEVTLIVRAAAVLSRPSDADLMAAVAGLTPVATAKGLDEAISGGFLEEADEERRYRFRLRLLARAVHDEISAGERRRLHLRAAHALEVRAEPRPLVEIAHHFERAGNRRQWLRAAEAASDAASRAGDDAEAAQILEQVLSGPGLPALTRRRMVLKLGDAALFARVPRKAIAIIEATLDDRSLPPGYRGELRLSLGRLRLILPDVAGAERELVRAAQELRRRPALAARTMAILAEMPSTASGEPGRSWLERALRSAERLDDAAIRTEVLGTRASLLLGRAHPAGLQAARDLPWRTTCHREQLALVRSSKYLALAAMSVGHYREAEVLLDRGETIRRELDHGRFAVGLASIRAWLGWRTGRWAGLELAARQLLAANDQAPGLSVGNEMTVAFLLLAAGSTDAAAQRLVPLLEIVGGQGMHLAAATIAGALARMHLLRGNPSEARATATAGILGVREHGLWASVSFAACDAVDALLADGRPAEASDVVGEFAHGVRGADAPAAKAALFHCRGALAEAQGHRDRAVRLFASAERAWRRLPAPYEAARARERRGRCLLPDGREADAIPALVGALEDFHALGARGEAVRLAAELRAHGGIALPRPWRPGRRPYGTELSPREAEVAGLAGAGRKNKEIAAELFISERTVEKHVASVLRKLGLDSRQDIARALQRKGGAGKEMMGGADLAWRRLGR